MKSAASRTNLSSPSSEERTANASIALRSNSIPPRVPDASSAMIQLYSSDPSIQSQILELQRSNLSQEGIVSRSVQDPRLLSLLASNNERQDQQLLMLQQELQYRSIINQQQIQHSLSPFDAAPFNAFMFPTQYQSPLQQEQQWVQRRALEVILARGNQQLQASRLLPQLSVQPIQETLASSVNEPPMDSELLNTFFGAQSRAAEFGTEPRRFEPTLLAQPDDAVVLSSYQAFLRQNIEFFQATLEEASTHVRGRNTPVSNHQVGIRCIHCKHVPLACRQKGSMYFPSNVLRIYQAAQNMATTHMRSGLCSDMPDPVKELFQAFMVTKSTGGGGGREYWAKCARDLGLGDTPDGIRLRCNAEVGSEILGNIRGL